MEAIVTYELKTAAVLAVFYLFYNILLTHETFHRVNRIVLLCSSIAAFVLPLCVITVTKEVAVPLHSAFSLPVDMTETHDASSVMLIPFTLYMAGVVVTAVIHLRSYLRAWRMIKRCDTHSKTANITIHQTDEPCAPFSLFNHIVINSADMQNGSKEIIIHEKAHVEARHSWDILIINIGLCMQWFNPAAWMLKRDLQTIHEYEADEAVLRSGTDAESYQLLLIKKAVGKRLHSVANSLNHSNLKKRITMMLSEKSSSRRMWKLAYVLPLVCGTMAAFAEERVVYIEQTPLSPDKVTKNIQISDTVKVYSSIGNDNVKVVGFSSEEEVDYFIDGKKATKEEFELIDPNNIAFINVNKNPNRIDITLKKKGNKAAGSENVRTENISVIKIDKTSDNNIVIHSSESHNGMVFSGDISENAEIYIDGIKSTTEEMNKLPADEIAFMEINKEAGELSGKISITTKNQLQQQMEIEAQKVEMEAKKVEMEARRIEMEAQKIEMEAQKVEMEARREEMEARKEEMEARREEMNARREEMEKRKEEMKARKK
ncbi:MAG: hypothetical protein J6K90_02085 [Tidjanibacter sp.]|nr:hypothetical protein [Tidjanibacter sp.]